ncbi:Na+/H+ antiporter NhaA [Pseudomonas matsuisoli]|uniref:Na(+)/H(+) antiporter NhaA n=1 Tax=Pseudomonas matsuisoli TaxID=1515666 RepID=A0A917PJ02_9PSED|nr:Na+/H+ antiporter NhaA [Pseudomonas matsuisoli]GGJ79806.1 Na(+)/H(+) antiporter NhaA 1 [Pseudomonas matsuisoli]
MHPESSRVSQAQSPFFIRFLHAESSGGIVLIIAAVLALIVANSSLSGAYFDALHVYVAGLSIHHWINDGLMAIFFLLVGLEIKRELLAGQLATWERRALPGFAALGGMLAPALVYVYFNAGSEQTMAGWAIPAATDIAFALGVLSLLGKRVPISLKVFLSALAILDDLGAVLIIAMFYTSELSVWMLAGALACVAVLMVLNKSGATRLLPYLLVGAVMWFFTLKSGVHATLAGVILALCIPIAGKSETDDSPLMSLEGKLHLWVAFLIVPVFGFANAGVSLAGFSVESLLSPVSMGVALGLLLGKQVGITLFSLLAIKSGVARLPQGSSWLQLYGIALLCGIGFTMSLFIGMLAFPNTPALVDEVKVGVLLGSLLSAVLGVAVLLLAAKPARHPATR